MTDPDLIVIGAGISGLATGIYAQLNGYDTTIVEHHSQAGGVAAAWDHGDYLFDAGIHFSMGHEPGTSVYRLYRELGIVPGTSFSPIRTYGRYIDEVSGWEFEVGADLDRFAAELKAVSPDDAKLIDDLVSSARAMQGLDMGDFGMAKPPELMSRADSIREMWAARKMWRYMSGRYGQTVARYTRDAHDPRVKAVLENLFLPYVPVWFVSMILALIADESLSFIDGGCRDFVWAMEDRFEALGGTVRYKARVDDILVEGDSAVGVRLADGSELRSGAVVSAADGRSTIFDMLGGKYVDDAVQERYDKWRVFDPMITATFGVSRTFPDDPAFVTVRFEQPLVAAGEIADAAFVRLFNYSDAFAPSGHTVVQVEFATAWDPWHDLYERDREAYNATKDQLAADISSRLDRHWSGFTEQIEAIDVATPVTWWRYTLNHRGAWEGWTPTSDAMRTRIPRMLPGLSRFYMAGQWVMPGGGVPPCLYSGKHAIQLLCRDDERDFASEG